MNSISLLCLFFFVSDNFFILTLGYTNRYSKNAAKDKANSSPYWNYLSPPRLHFFGRFKADVPTVNNNPSSFDTENFSEHDEELLSWNPRGTGEFSVQGHISQVCYYNGTCTTNRKVEPIVKADFLDGGNKTSAKMVDLDTQAQFYSEVWGWRIQIGEYFSADFTPSPLQFLWKKKIGAGRGDLSSGAAFQSELTNLKWNEHKTDSAFIKELRYIMKNDKNVDSHRLSIRFNLDFMDLNHYGRIAGSIGLMGIKSPSFFSQGRFMNALTDLHSDAPFMVDQTIQKVIFDFGNSFQFDEKGEFAVNNKSVYVAVNLDGTESTCSSRFFWLGRVLYHLRWWYHRSTGIQSFPEFGILSQEEMDIVNSHPLVVMEVTGNWPDIKCKQVLMVEPAHGIDIRPYSKWTARKNPPETHKFHVFAKRFGAPIPNTRVHFVLACSQKGHGHEPKICTPPQPFTSSATTNEDGIATLKIWTKDPKNPRKVVDGQLYQYLYYLEGFEPKIEKLKDKQLTDKFLAIRVFDHFVPHSPPTWLDDIYPIFRQYANLYPVMKRIVDLGNYYDVVKKRKTVLMTMKLPISDPNYMPITRDLSDSKRKAIIEWLSNEKPLIGRSRDFYTLDNLRKHLQTALHIEFSTIPPYMTAMATIKQNYNNDIKNIIKTIVNQEMLHMTLVANILNAIGGKPIFFTKRFSTVYPTSLPGGVHPDLVVPIQKLSMELIRNVFMKIEQPELNMQKHYEFKHTFDFVEKPSGHNTKRRVKRELAPDASVDNEEFPCLDSQMRDSLDKDFRDDPSLWHFQLESLRSANKRSHRPFPIFNNDLPKQHKTIGGFYRHILNMLCYLTKCGTDSRIFTGDPARQVHYVHGSVHGKSLHVVDFPSAVRAIKTIIEQGEGSSPCNPMFWSNGTVDDLSHYFLFHSIVEKRQIKVSEVVQNDEPSNDDSDDEFTKVCGGKYSFKGPKIVYDPNGVWPMIPNPKMSKYKKGSLAYLTAKEFNKVYTKLLKSLERIFNGYPDDLKDALGIMYSLQVHLDKLIRTPVHPDGDPDVGPNAGPTFDFTP